MNTNGNQAATALLEDLLAIPSVNGTAGELQIASFIAAYLGAGAELAQLDDKRANVVFRLKGREPGQATLLNGHLDTVPFGSPESWQTPPDQPVERRGWLYGRGASDMKSGLAAMLFALCQAKESGFVPQHDIVFLATCDEETGGAGAQHAVDNGLLEDVAAMVIGEPTGNQVSIASKGALWLWLEAVGKTAHGAYPSEGVSAVEGVYALYQALKEELAQQRHPLLQQATCSLNKIAGGIKENMVPDRCSAILDIRTVPAFDNAWVLARIPLLTAALQQRFPTLEIAATPLNNRMPTETGAGHVLTQMVQGAVQQATGRMPDLVGTYYFTDASVFLRKKQIPTVLLGPGESPMAHQPNEGVSLSCYGQAVAAYGHLIQCL